MVTRKIHTVRVYSVHVNSIISPLWSIWNRLLLGACMNILLRVHGWLYDMVRKSGDFVGESQLLPARPHVGDSAFEALDCSLSSRRETSQALNFKTCSRVVFRLLNFDASNMCDWSVSHPTSEIHWLETNCLSPAGENSGCSIWTSWAVRVLNNDPSPLAMQCYAVFSAVFLAWPEARVAAWNHHDHHLRFREAMEPGP